MGALLIGEHTKGFTGLSSVALSKVEGEVNISKSDVSPALGSLLAALKENGCKDGKPTEVMILIRGEREHAFTFTVDDLAEIQEILQWTVGQE